MFNYIINPCTKEQYSIISTNGKNLLKSYIKLFKGGNTVDLDKTKIDRNSNLLRKCNNLYKQTITSKVEEKHKCDYDNYRSIKTIKNSIHFKEDVWKKLYGTELKKRSLTISNKVLQFLRKNSIFNEFFNKNNDKIITVLGPLEDILGFFYNFNLKNLKDPIYKKFFFLSVDKWSLDLNYDFITCSYLTNDKNNFKNMYSECPIILINKGKTNILNDYPSHDNKIRITHCEKTWINKILKDSKYTWNSFKITNDIYINLLVKNNKNKINKN